jgi:hypothetical protein
MQIHHLYFANRCSDPVDLFLISQYFGINIINMYNADLKVWRFCFACMAYLTLLSVAQIMYRGMIEQSLNSDFQMTRKNVVVP